MIKMTLDEVLEGYAIETPTGNDMQILQKWMKWYPQYAEQLQDFAAARAILRHAPEEDLSAEEEARYREEGLQILRDFLGKKKAAQEVLPGLAAVAAEKGLKKPELAEKLGLSLSLLVYLDKKRLVFSTIPKSLIKKIADVLEVAEQSVSAYLNQPPDFQAQASFKAAIRPELSQPKSFSDAVREDQTLTPEEKKKLLDLE
jgi:hypothetical protein